MTINIVIYLTRNCTVILLKESLLLNLIHLIELLGINLM